MPEDVVAINFNLYEEEDNEWSVQLVGSDYYKENDEDWACSTVYSTEENLYTFKHKGDWEAVLEICIDAVKDYLAVGKYTNELKEYKAIGIGFVDGDLIGWNKLTCLILLLSIAIQVIL